ncbi:MAG: diguanylate cyclase [Oscillospiraceae bacterium]|nr:diguanylate cyclase [Oscillospiraceae bacterium]
MSSTAETLFEYMRKILYPANENDHQLDLENLEDEYEMLGKGLIYLAQCVSETRSFAKSLAKGDLSVMMPPVDNELAAPLKNLQASLKHLTWQSQQVAKGDYKQRVDFMGDFADAFNTMVEQLADRQKKLEDEISLSRKHAQAMEQSNLLLSKLVQNVPGQIFVISAVDYEVLLANDSARLILSQEPDYIAKLMKLLPKVESLVNSHYHELQFTKASLEHYLTINTYQIEWDDENAIALVINDVSVERRQLKDLEDCAYKDALTGVYNRYFGMLTLDEWLVNNRQFALIFIDLDNLKYVNDRFGHGDGDEYIKRVAKHLQSYSPETVVCRLGGDEYMLLAPHQGFGDACDRMESIQYYIQNDEYLRDKDYVYSISIGIVSVEPDNNMVSSEILSLADERMYEHKRSKKMRSRISKV